MPGITCAAKGETGKRGDAVLKGGLANQGSGFRARRERRKMGHAPISAPGMGFLLQGRVTTHQNFKMVHFIAFSYLMAANDQEG